VSVSDSFDGRSAAFEYFRDRHESRDAIEENKELLKAKYAEAKALGERANNSRCSSVSYFNM